VPCTLYKVKEAENIRQGAEKAPDWGSDERRRDVIIVGSGPSGLHRGPLHGRANLNPLVVEGFAWAVCLQQTTDVENYPGFPDGVMGPEMMRSSATRPSAWRAPFLTEQADVWSSPPSPAPPQRVGVRR